MVGRLYLALIGLSLAEFSLGFGLSFPPTSLSRHSPSSRSFRLLAEAPTSSVSLDSVAEAPVSTAQPAATAEAAPVSTAQPAATKPKPEEKSILILSWFYAAERELKLVKRVFKRNGFTDINIHESPVKTLAKPRGWYRSFMEKAMTESPEYLNRHYDVVYCMSGGFLNLYILLASGVPLTFDKLVMDSTPILPKPSSFVRFARAYMEDNGFELIPRVLPKPIHRRAISLKWWFSVIYVRLKHRFKVRRQLRAIGGEVQQIGENWGGSVSRMASHSNWEGVADDAISTIFDRKDLESVFITNAEDPYICPDDVQKVMEMARGYGNNVKEVQVDVPHIQGIFRSPNSIFDALK